ncbi:hypothetical protein K469DRAFT_713793 [Zopfia rhizophila CBS 207.26]|uniref:Uncharacterized protein n=1 Tax=Zopfia rhizophila CBS 207.26 TaxID=1314779 RepID=A0A6A6DT35_9PEZI|nr:hypothetical protein K469DRAFT_713793 [Zopfia rhizophila CBS 207.26]
MTKSKKRNSVARNANLWDPRDRIHLLAWLDYCIRRGINFEASVVDHLQATTGKTFSWKQVKSKLNSTWKNWGHEDSKLSDIYSRGSSCLKSLLDKEREEIAEVIGHLEQSSAPYRLRNTPSHAAASPPPMASVITIPGPAPNISVPVRGISESQDQLPVELERDLGEKAKQLVEKDSKIMAQENRILSLETRLSSLSKDHDELQHCIRATGAHERDPDLLRKLQYENSILQQRLVVSQNIQKDTASIEGDDLGLTDAEIRRDLDVIERRIAEACSSLGNWESPVMDIQVQPEQFPYVESLLQKACGLKIHQLRQFSLDMDIQKLQLLQSIAAASVCISAFESGFPEFLAKDSLLDKYRELILTQGGIVALRNLDLLAHKSLISEHYFDLDIIMSKSKELASLLSNTLAPFLTPSSPVIGDSEVTDEDVLEPDFFAVVPAAESFPEVFARALRLKSKLFLSQKRYQFIFPQPGDEFSPETMKENGQSYDEYVERDKRNRVHGVPNNRQRVILCLFPSLYSYSLPAAGEGRATKTDAEDVVVNYQNFSLDSALSSTQQPSLVAKAIVLISK